MGIYIKNIKKPWRCDECMFTDSLDECIFLKTDADIDGLNIDCPIVEIADRKTENSSEKPNNCEDEPSEDCELCKHFKYRHPYWECEFDTFEECNYEPKTEPQADDIGDCNICKYVGLVHRCNQCINGSMFCKVEDEPQTCEDCKHNGEKHAYDYACDKCTDMDKFQHEDEPQTICKECVKYPCESWQKGIITDKHNLVECRSFEPKDEPQTDCAWK